MEKPEQPAPPPPPVERDDVQVRANRCPFCHDAVQVERTDWVSCRRCQARHHVACWEEGGACSACGDTQFLAMAQTTSQGHGVEPNDPPQGADADPFWLKLLGWSSRSPVHAWGVSFVGVPALTGFAFFLGGWLWHLAKGGDPEVIFGSSMFGLFLGALLGLGLFVVLRLLEFARIKDDA